jgi:ABC-type multidrug transport system ATPase subunit
MHATLSPSQPASPFSPNQPIVDVRRLTRRFGATTALDDVSLAIPRGGVFGLIGANGAGKTTLIKHLFGMLKAESGTVQVFGQDPVQNPSACSAASVISPKTATSPTGCASAS